jgi:SsrA-binding protein
MRSYKPIVTNKRARFDYTINESIVAGIVLTGHEVKSLRAGNVSLKSSFVNIHNDELWLNNAHITPYPAASLPANYDPGHARKLLVHAKQLQRMALAKQAGQHIIPLSIGRQGRFVKAMIGIGPSKKRYDKRQVIKKRESEREAAAASKRARK